MQIIHYISCDSRGNFHSHWASSCYAGHFSTCQFWIWREIHVIDIYCILMSVVYAGPNVRINSGYNRHRVFMFGA